MQNFIDQGLHALAIEIVNGSVKITGPNRPAGSFA
jgi:hypothetical protein